MRFRPVWGEQRRISRTALRWWLSFVIGAAAVLLLVPALEGDKQTDMNSPASRMNETEVESPAEYAGKLRAGIGTTENKRTRVSEDPDPGMRDRELAVNVYIQAEERIETIPLETYVRGVVAGEMPADFEPEALKAQAIAARTYIVRKLLLGGDKDTAADVTAEQDDQVYIPLDRLEMLWPQDSEAKLEKIARAVRETEGLVLTYEGEPIQAAFFSTSGGYTENSEDYWKTRLPYLRSVPSPWDAQLSPRYKQTAELPLNDFYQSLGIGKRDRKGGIKLLSRTEGRSVKSIKIGRKTFTGREVRERLGLPSAVFNWTVKDGKILITTFGFGHGVGMSQWGAQALAKAGHEAEQILSYYYQGVAVEPAARLLEAAGRFKT